MSNSNCHARSKQKRKKLRLKNLLRRILEIRLKKHQKANKPRGITITGIHAKEVALHVNQLAPKNYQGFFHVKSLFDHGHKLKLNQRQKRKRARQQNRPVKR